MRMEHWWNDTVSVNSEVQGEKFSQCHLFNRIVKINLPEIEPGPLR